MGLRARLEGEGKFELQGAVRVPDPGSGIRARGEGTTAAPAAAGHSCRPRSRGAPRRKCWRRGNGSLGR